MKQSLCYMNSRYAILSNSKPYDLAFIYWLSSRVTGGNYLIQHLHITPFSFSELAIKCRYECRYACRYERRFPHLAASTLPSVGYAWPWPASNHLGQDRLEVSFLAMQEMGQLRCFLLARKRSCQRQGNSPS